MRRPLRRETFIALRARRQAHQIASEIANPHLKIPEFQQEVRSERDLKIWPEDPEISRTSLFVLLVLVTILVVLAIYTLATNPV